MEALIALPDEKTFVLDYIAHLTTMTERTTQHATSNDSCAEEEYALGLKNLLNTLELNLDWYTHCMRVALTQGELITDELEQARLRVDEPEHAGMLAADLNS